MIIRYYKIIADCDPSNQGKTWCFPKQNSKFQVFKIYLGIFYVLHMRKSYPQTDP